MPQTWAEELRQQKRERRQRERASLRRAAKKWGATPSEIKAAKKQAYRPERSTVRCTGVCKNGQQCKRMCAGSSDHCWQHSRAA